MSTCGASAMTSWLQYYSFDEGDVPGTLVQLLEEEEVPKAALTSRPWLFQDPGCLDCPQGPCRYRPGIERSEALPGA